MQGVQQFEGSHTVLLYVTLYTVICNIENCWNTSTIFSCCIMVCLMC